MLSFLEYLRLMVLQVLQPYSSSFLYIKHRSTFKFSSLQMHSSKQAKWNRITWRESTIPMCVEFSKHRHNVRLILSWMLPFRLHRPWWLLLAEPSLYYLKVHVWIAKQQLQTTRMTRWRRVLKYFLVIFSGCNTQNLVKGLICTFHGKVHLAGRG